MLRGIDLKSEEKIYKEIKESSLKLIESWASFHLNLLNKPDLILYLIDNISDNNINMIQKVFSESFHYSNSYKYYTNRYDGLENFTQNLNKVELQSLETIIVKLKGLLSNISENTSHIKMIIGITHIFSDIMENFVYLLFLVSVFVS